MPTAASCPALKSGSYQALDASNTSKALARVTVDAVALSVGQADGSSRSYAAVSGSPCAFVTADGRASLHVAKSGVAFVAYADAAGARRSAVLVPEQQVALGELSGRWHWIFQDGGTDGSLRIVHEMNTLDAGGRITAGQRCVDLQPCSDWTPLPSHALSEDALTGGFAYAPDGAGYRATLLPVKAATGELALFGMLLDGQGKFRGLVYLTRQAALGLPAAGAVQSFWTYNVDASGMASAVGEAQSTVQSLDAAANSYTAVRSGTGVAETFKLNTPRDGMLHFAGGPLVDNTGVTRNYLPTLRTPLTGMGITLQYSLSMHLGLPAAQVLSYIVDKP